MNLRVILEPFARSWAIAGESVMLPLLGVALGIWINPLDPLWTHAAFPWIWFAPLILALRYGPFPGLAGAAVLLLAWAGFYLAGWINEDFPKINFLGGLIAVMLCGEFSSAWITRARRAEGIQFYLDQRLEYLTHQYYLLRLSHDRLEQDLIGRPMAMRDALATLQAVIRDGSDSARGMPGAAGVLRLLAQYCQIEVASLHRFDDTRLVEIPIATTGKQDEQGGLDASDPLVQRALESGRLSHVAQSVEAGDLTSRYVIVAPLATMTGERIGLLTVERVPFFALHEEMLQTLNLLLGYYTDGLVAQQLAAPILAAVPACPPEFAAELQRLWRVRGDSDVCSIVVALDIRTSSGYEDVALELRRQRRALDVSWLIELTGRAVLVTLMPLGGTAAAEGYIARIDDWAHRQSGQKLSEFGIFPHVLHVDAQPPQALLDHLFTLCHVPAEILALRPAA